MKAVGFFVPNCLEGVDVSVPVFDTTYCPLSSFSVIQSMTIVLDSEQIFILNAHTQKKCCEC